MSKKGHTLAIGWCVLVAIAMIPVSLAAVAVGLLLAALWFFFAIVLPDATDPLKLPDDRAQRAIDDADAEVQRIHEWYGPIRDGSKHYIIQWPDVPGEPTSATINRLPKHIRDYLGWLHTDADPASTLQDNWHLTRENKALRILLEEHVDRVADDGDEKDTWLRG